jgi:hypothetical protein
VEHPQDLKEPDSTNGRRGEDLTIAAHRQHNYRRPDYDQICEPE